MSTIGDAFAGLRKVLLMQENLERVEQNFDRMADDLRRTRDYAVEIDKRVTRLEGMIEGAAIVAGRQPRLGSE
jgi:hypothetical protein